MQKKRVALLLRGARTGGSRRSGCRGACRRSAGCRRRSSSFGPFSFVSRDEKGLVRGLGRDEAAVARARRACSRLAPGARARSDTRRSPSRPHDTRVTSLRSPLTVSLTWRVSVRASRPLRHPPPPLDRRDVDPPVRLRALHDQPAVRPLVRVVLDPGPLGVRVQPARAEDVRDRRAGAARRRLPLERRRDAGPAGSERAVAAGVAVNPGSRTSSYFSTQLRRIPLEGPAHDVRGDLPAGHAGLQLERAHQEGARRDQGGDAGRGDRQPHRPRPAPGGHRRHGRARASRSRS